MVVVCYGDVLFIVVIFVVLVIICEGISWVLIYCIINYKLFCFIIDCIFKKIEMMKSQMLVLVIVVVKKFKSKKMDWYELLLKEFSCDLLLFKFKFGVVVVFVFFVVFGLLLFFFEGKVVVKLLFLFIFFIQKMLY